MKENNYMLLMAKALKAANDATKDHDYNDWFPCGSSSVLVKPRNSKFAKWLIANMPERSDNGLMVHDAEYKKAILIRTLVFNQAMNPQVAWTSAFAQVLREEGINASTWSYID